MEPAKICNPAKDNTVDREQAMRYWLAHDCAIQATASEPMDADASLRRYFRIRHQGQTFVVMDAPPPLENCRPFIAISHALRNLGLNAPEVIAADVTQGFLLLTDFGNATYLTALHQTNADGLYTLALHALATLSTCSPHLADHVVPPFTAQWMWQEWIWFKEWFIQQYLGLALPTNIETIEVSYGHLVQSAVTQPQVFMHRDYHSANLMLLPEGQVGLLDFQDAFIGPLTYDLASLLRDAYIAWPAEQVQRWACYYFDLWQERWGRPDIDQRTFLYWFDLMSLQRSLKALMTFARKHVRDQDPRYLQHVPRTFGYVLDISQRYPEYSALHDYLRTIFVGLQV
jgi:aminoglycoside/choline kinase family phosphotransferase